MDPKIPRSGEEIKLHDLVCCHDPAAIKEEVGRIANMFGVDFDQWRFAQAMVDLVRLFGGEYPGFLASNTSYHNLEHTNGVVLAMARLLHGLYLDDGVRFSGSQLLVGLLAAMFHDTGLLQKDAEKEGSGARHMVGHEQRSIVLAAEYMQEHGFSDEEVANCGTIIMATALGQSLEEIPFCDQTTALLGKVMGAADLLAQMADRAYLEKLPLLYREFVEAGVKGYDSELDLFSKTMDFYCSLAQPRLQRELGNVQRVLSSHFQVRWGIERDLYAEEINSNLVYLQKLLGKCGSNYACLLQHLNRGGDC